MSNEHDFTIPSSSGEGDIPVYMVSSGAGTRPGLLLVPAIFGIDEGTRKLARDVAALGAHVWVVDPFWRTTPGAIPRDKEGFQRAIARARTIDDDSAVADLSDLIDAMSQIDNCNGNIVVAGLCFAGKFALLMTSRGLAVAGASFHGARMTAYTDLADDIHVPLSLHFGDEDVAIPIEDVETLRAAFAGNEDTSIFLHEGGVKHGFADPGSDGFNPSVYPKALAELGRLLDGAR